MAWDYPLIYEPQGAFLHMCSVSLVPKRGKSEDLLIHYLNRILPLFVLAMTIALTIALTVTSRCLQETNNDYLSCFCCYFHFRGQIEGCCKCFNWSPSTSCLKKCYISIAMYIIIYIML